VSAQVPPRRRVRRRKAPKPSTLRAICPSLPTAAEKHIPSRTMDDLDLVDSAFVATGTLRARA
jgi:hypothetical protein